MAQWCLAALLPMALTHHASAQSYSLTNVWQLTNGTPGSHLATGDVNRGLAYSAVSNQVFVCNKGVTGSGTTPAIDVFDGTGGALVGNVNVSSMAGGNFRLDQVAVADDGVLYGGNLTTTVASNPYKIYRWQTWVDGAPVTAFSGDPTGGAAAGTRMGDNIAITGSGVNTVVLTPVESGTTPTTNVVLFSTLDGTNFTPTLVSIVGLPGLTAGNGPAFGVAFYTNNTFLFKPSGASIYLVQFPANFAAQASVTATVLLTNSFGGNNVLLSYNPAAKLLGTGGPIPNSTASTTVTPISLYSVPAFSSISSLASTNFSTTNANGNFVGQVALGGAGRTNFIYALDCNNGVQAAEIGFAAAAVPPTITTQPAGGAIYTNDPAFTLTVQATGSQPLSFQWQFNTVSNLATATNITAATNASYTLNYPPTSASGWYDVVITNLGGRTSSIPVQLTVVAPSASTVVTQLWTLAPGSQPYLDGTSYDTRGLAYDQNTMTVLVANKGSAFGIYVLNANVGTNLFTMNTLGIGQVGNTFSLDQIGVADDGVLYAGNLTTAGSGANFGLVSWSSVNSNAAPFQAYAGDPGNGSGDRWGDTMAVRGAGVNTEILLGSYSGFLGGPSTNVALLTTVDGINFTATTLIISNVPPGFSSLGICFGAGDTFWAKSPGYDLRQIAFERITGTGTVIADYPAATSGISSFSSMSAIGLDPTNNLLGGVTFNDIPNDLTLYQISTNGIPLYLFHQAFFPSLNGNIQQNGATVLKFPRVYSLDVNNGIVALSYGVPPPPPLPPYSITAITEQAGTGVRLTWGSYAGRTYQVQYKTLLTDSLWNQIGGLIVATGPTTSYTNTTPTGATRFYRIQGQ
jgi:hypothetical protein